PCFSGHQLKSISIYWGQLRTKNAHILGLVRGRHLNVILIHAIQVLNQHIVETLSLSFFHLTTTPYTNCTSKVILAFNVLHHVRVNGLLIGNYITFIVIYGQQWFIATFTTSQCFSDTVYGRFVSNTTSYHGSHRKACAEVYTTSSITNVL